MTKFYAEFTDLLTFGVVVPKTGVLRVEKIADPILQSLPLPLCVTSSQTPAFALIMLHKNAQIHPRRVWNSLPDCLTDPAVDSEQFRRDLKTYLFAGHSRR